MALETASAAMLPDAPTRLSTSTTWPKALDKGSAKARAMISGDEPPGKPTIKRTLLVGQGTEGGSV